MEKRGDVETSLTLLRQNAHHILAKPDTMSAEAPDHLLAVERIAELFCFGHEPHRTRDGQLVQASHATPYLFIDAHAINAKRQCSLNHSRFAK